MLLRCPHSKLLCPRLLKLSWAADRVFGGDFVPFLSPRLREVHLVSRPGTLFSFAEAISAIPASSLNSLRLSIIGDEAVRDVVVNMLTTCGKNLTTLEVSRMDQLRDSSWCHIMLLPRLHILETDQSPPTMSHHCLSVPFPSLRHITLRGPAAFGWIHYLTEVNVRRVSADTGSQPRRVASRLCRLYCDYGVELDVPFVSHFRVFRNLSTLILGSGCSLTTSCTFHLTDEDVSRFAMELPGLGELSLGSPCPANTCGTTVNSLLALSTYCKGLRMLCIHFNTRNFARDMRESLHNPLRHHSHPPSRCPLVVLNVGLAPLTAEALGEDVFPTLAGLVDIFPGLMRIRFALLSPRASCAWRELSAQIPFFQEMRRSLPAVFIQQTRGNHQSPPLPQRTSHSFVQGPATQNQQPRG